MDRQRKWRALGLLATAEVMALATWFSATAILPALREEFALSDTRASLFSSAVSIGFIVGTLASAVTGLADRVRPTLLFAAGAFAAAGANAMLLALPPTHDGVIAARLGVGVALAFVYPIGMNIAASWADGDRGLLVGVLVGALTLGSATPHLINAVGGTDWVNTVQLTTVLAALAGLLVLAVPLGPAHSRPSRFEPAQVLLAFRDRGLRLANFGYFGHMWELYAMWAWIASYLVASFKLHGVRGPEWLASVACFAVLGAGAFGSVVAGVLADRFGRTMVTSVAMIVSGSCALLAGVVFGAAPWLVIAVALLWGFTIVADSAQFSSSVIELAESTLTGTMLTVQTSVGFALTLVSIHLIPELVGGFGWRFAFVPLALGPAFGVASMVRLRGLPEGLKLANGRR